jgi:hypothetical protein
MRTLLFVALLGCATATAAQAQDGAITSPSVSAANRTGFFIGFDPLAYASLTSDDEDYLMSHGDIALMYFPRAFALGKRPLLPFVQVGGGFRSLESTFRGGGAPQIYALEGEVFSVGAGLRYHVERRWAITLQGWWSSGEFNDERVGNTTTHNRNISATSTRVQAGLEWHRGRRGR